MKNVLYIIVLISFSKYLSGQTFKPYKQTPFLYFSADQKLKGRITPNAYIRKGDTLLILSKLDLNRFLSLFENAPGRFDSLFKKLPSIGYKYSQTDKFDKVLKQTTYKVHADIGSVAVIHRQEQDSVIWEISNSDYWSASNTCYITIVFKIRNEKANKTDPDNLEYVKIKSDYCDY